MIINHVVSLFHNLRFHTTLHWHHKATKFKWYKRWHDFKYAHHFHVFLVFIYLFSLLASLVSPTVPKAYASNSTWTQTTFNGTNDGQYADTVGYSSNTGLALASTLPANTVDNGNGTWTTTLQPDGTAGQDVRISAYSPTTTDNGQTLYVGYLTSGDQYPSLIRFTGISQIPAGSTISSAQLSLYETGLAPSGTATLYIQKLLRNWVETEASWNNYAAGTPWFTAGALNDIDRVAAASTTVAINTTYNHWHDIASTAGMVADVQSWVNGTTNNGWKLYISTASRYTGFASSENTNATIRPKLTVTYTPGPSYKSTGTYTTNAISPTNIYGNWGVLNWNATLNNQTVTVDVLDANGNPASGGNCTGGTGNQCLGVANGTDLGISTTTYPSLKLRANLSTSNAAESPILTDWSLGYTNDLTPPSVPSELTFNNQTNASVELTWQGSTDAELGLADPAYYIERAPDVSGAPGTFAEIGTSNTASYTDSGLDPNTRYYYRVRAKDVAGNYSAYSMGEMSVDGTTVSLIHFNEGSGAPVEQVNNLTGTMTGTPTWTTGKFGNGLNFNGTSAYVQFTNNALYGPTSQITIESWIKPSTLTGAHRIVDKLASPSFGYSLLQNGQNVTFQLYANGSLTQAITGNVITQADNWYYVVATYDGANMKVYVNGTSALTPVAKTGTINYGATPASLRIGNSSATTQYFAGTIDEVRISNTAKTATEISDYFGGAVASSSVVTLTNAPVLNQPSTTTNDSRPLISNSSSPDISFANQEVRLCDNTTEIARTRANSSGAFTFGDNKAANYSFETDSDANGRADSWNPWQNLLPPITTSMSNDAQDGTKAQRIQVNGAATGASGHLTTYTTSAGNHAPGQSATVSFWIKGSVSGANVRVQIDAATAAGAYITGVGGPDITVTQNYTRYSHTFNNLPANTSRVTAIINVRNFDTGDNVDLYIDNAKIDNYNRNLTDGSYTQLNAKAVNSAGQTILNTTPAADVSNYLSTGSVNIGLTVDTQVPVTTYSVSRSPAVVTELNGYFTTNPVISLSPSESGVTVYKWDDASLVSPTTYSAPINMDLTVGQGTHTLYWRTVDAASNIEQVRSQEFKLDTVSPGETTISIDASFLNTDSLGISSVSLGADDDTSGVGSVAFSSDNITYCNFESYNSNISINFMNTTRPNGPAACLNFDSIDGTKNLFVKFRDNAGNISSETGDTVVLDQQSPTNPTVTITATPEIPEDNWYNDVTPEFTFNGALDETSGLAGYYVYFGTEQAADPLIDGDIQYANTFSPTILSEDSGMTYYLKVRSVDEAGNIYTNPDNSVYELATYKLDVTKPAKINYATPNPAGWSAVNSFEFNWPVVEDVLVNGNSSGLKGYEYKREDDADWTFTTDNTVSDIQSYQTGVNIFLISSVDIAGNRSDEIPVNYYYSGSIAGPDNLQVDISQSENQTKNSYKFTWSAPVGVTAGGYYYSVNSVPNTQNSTFTTDAFTGYEAFATQQGLNTFYIVTKDANGNVGWSNFSQVSFTCNTTAPGIPTAVLISDSSSRESSRWQLTINWDQPDTVTSDFNGYVVERSTDGNNYIQIATTSSQTTGYLDTNLDNNTTYYYRVRTRDNTGNISAQSSEVYKIPTGRYTTAPNLIGEPEVEIQATKVTVDWTTDRPSDSFLQIGTDTNYGMTQGQLESTHSHSVVASGLQPGTTYHYRAMWRDSDGNIGHSNDATFRTQDAPGISEVNITDIRLDSAIISWKTTTVSTSRIYYGKTTSYGQIATDQSSSQVTTHTIKLDNLDHSSSYNFKIQGTDTDGNVLNSDNYVFETLTFPRVSEVKLEQQNNEATSTVKITWKTNVPTSSVVDYSGAGVTKEASKSTLETSHMIFISNLKDNTQYNFSVGGRDAFGNLAESSGVSYKTAFDSRAPEISEVNTETSIVGFGADAKAQVVISWFTDELSSSQVEYSEGVSGEIYSMKTQEDSSLTTSHVIVISDLKPSSSYYFRVLSKDSSQNEGKSGVNSVLTEQARSSIIDIIINSFEKTLGWVFGSFSS